MTCPPEEHRFSKEHLWLTTSEKKIYVGFTNVFFGSFVKIDLIYVRDGVSFKNGEVCGLVYSKRKFQNMIMPVSGTILSINMNIFLDPTLFNQEPYRHWVMIIDMWNPLEFNNLLSGNEYKSLIDCIIK
jgi:glycine cleavage system H protein